MNEKNKKCCHCRRLFVLDHRNRTRQNYCNREPCRKASKTASQKKWLSKTENKGYFRGSDNVKRVQEWRKNNPGYWKRTKCSTALQDSLMTQPIENKADNGVFNFCFEFNGFHIILPFLDSNKLINGKRFIFWDNTALVIPFSAIGLYYLYYFNTIFFDRVN